MKYKDMDKNTVDLLAHEFADIANKVMNHQFLEYKSLIILPIFRRKMLPPWYEHCEFLFLEAFNRFVSNKINEEVKFSTSVVEIISGIIPKCSKCGATHVWGDWIESKMGGTRASYCPSCNKSVKKVIDELKNEVIDEIKNKEK